jgi:hypothetical protein
MESYLHSPVRIRDSGNLEFRDRLNVMLILLRVAEAAVDLAVFRNGD